MSIMPRYTGAPGSFRPYAVEVSSGVWKPAFKCCCCCKCGNCCYSAKSRINLTKPTLVYTGSDPATILAVNAINALDTSALLPITPYPNGTGLSAPFCSQTMAWIATGASFFQPYPIGAYPAPNKNYHAWAYVSQFCPSNDWSYKAGVRADDDSYDTWFLQGDHYLSSSCCNFSDGDEYHGTYVDEPPEVFTISGNSSASVTNNKCCYDGENCRDTTDDACPDGAYCEEGI